MRRAFLVLFALLGVACGGDGDSGASTGGAGGGGGASGGSGGNAGSGATGGSAGSSGSGATGGGGATGGTGGIAPIDLCAGLVTDKDPHPMTPLAQPALGQTVTDAEFGTTIRRISQVAPGGANPAIRPLYSTVSAWNADESRLLLYDVAKGHALYDGKSYAFIEYLEINPPDLEQVYWHTSDPDILLYVDGTTLIRYHVSAHQKETVGTFDFCSGGATAGSDPMFISWDANRIGLGCGGTSFVWDIAQGAALGQLASSANPPQVAPSGSLAYLDESGEVTNEKLEVLRTLDLTEPWGHASLGQLANGHDTWDGVVYDPGPGGDDDIGSLVVFDLLDGSSSVVIGPKTGWPYPPTGHISTMAYRQPGWVFVSTIGDHSGAGTLDDENLIADTNTGKVCRIGRHRSYGKDNTHLAEPYWAEPHTVPSPSGTRAVFASDWGNGATVDAYVVELPSYVP
jgi:hypothetical protein